MYSGNEYVAEIARDEILRKQSAPRWSSNKGAHMGWTGTQPAADVHLTRLEKMLSLVAAQAQALIEQTKREVERSRDLLTNEGQARRAKSTEVAG